MSSEKLSPFFAVFNCHLNNAKKRANKKFINLYGREKFNRTMCPLFRLGIMGIFEEFSPIKPIRDWVDWVTEFVNEDREDA